MLVENFSQRGSIRPLNQRIRAYFAPVARATSVPSIFDAAAAAGFDLDDPPLPWIDAGWVLNFKRFSATKVETLTSGRWSWHRSNFAKP